MLMTLIVVGLLIFCARICSSCPHLPIRASSGVPLPLLDLFQRPHRAVQRVLVVSSELRVGAFQRGVSVGLGLLDAM